MKRLLLAAILLFGLAGSVSADEIYADVKEVNGNTIVTCSPHQEGEIDRAYFTLYESDGNLLSISRQEMKITHDNTATYELPGVYNVVGGICKFIMADSNPKITRGDFLISMK